MVNELVPVRTFIAASISLKSSTLALLIRTDLFGGVSVVGAWNGPFEVALADLFLAKYQAARHFLPSPAMVVTAWASHPPKV